LQRRVVELLLPVRRGIAVAGLGEAGRPHPGGYCAGIGASGRWYSGISEQPPSMQAIPMLATVRVSIRPPPSI